jgi:hypothetical protein
MTLIAREARRFAGHPALWLIPIVITLTTAVETPTSGRTAGYWYGTVVVAVTFFAPIIVLFIANLVASSARRARAVELLNATPTSDRRRTLATCLGIALTLAAAGAVAVLAMTLIDAVGGVPAADRMSAGELAQLPLILTGAGLLGVLAARWLPFAGGILIVFVAATLGALVLFRRIDAGQWWMWWTTATSIEGGPPVAGEPWLHAAYLAGLCTCAAVAAVHRHQVTRLAVVGGPILAATLALGWLQLP